MGQFTTSSRPSNHSFVITKYLLLLLIIMNILSTIWVGIYNKNAVDRMKAKYPDDHWTGDEGRGHSAELWERLCITFLVFENIFNVMGLLSTLQENYCLSIIYSVLMFVSALYGSAAKFVRGSVCSFLMPLVVAVVASVFAHMIRMDNYEPTPSAERKRQMTAVITEEPIYTPPSKRPKPVSKQLSNPLISNSRHNSLQNGRESIQLNGFKSTANGTTTYV